MGGARAGLSGVGVEEGQLIERLPLASTAAEAWAPLPAESARRMGAAPGIPRGERCGKLAGCLGQRREEMPSHSDGGWSTRTPASTHPKSTLIAVPAWMMLDERAEIGR